MQSRAYTMVRCWLVLLNTTQSSLQRYLCKANVLKKDDAYEQVLLEHGAEMEYENSDARAALSIAAQYGSDLVAQVKSEQKSATDLLLWFSF